MGDKPFPGFPWFSYPAPKFVEKNKVYNELYLRIENLEERVAELTTNLAEHMRMTAKALRLLNEQDKPFVHPARDTGESWD